MISVKRLAYHVSGQRWTTGPSTARRAISARSQPCHDARRPARSMNRWIRTCVAITSAAVFLAPLSTWAQSQADQMKKLEAAYKDVSKTIRGGNLAELRKKFAGWKEWKQDAAVRILACSGNLPAFDELVSAGHVLPRHYVVALEEHSCDEEAAKALLRRYGSREGFPVNDVITTLCTLHASQDALKQNVRSFGISIVPLLLDHGANPQRFVTLASAFGDTEMLGRLLKQGATPTGTALAAAVFHKRLEVVDALLAAGADANFQQPFTVYSATGDRMIDEEQVLRARLSKEQLESTPLPSIGVNGAPLSIPNPIHCPRGPTPLYWAIRIGDDKIVETLLKHGANKAQEFQIVVPGKEYDFFHMMGDGDSKSIEVFGDRPRHLYYLIYFDDNDRLQVNRTTEGYLLVAPLRYASRMGQKSIAEILARY